MSLQFQDTHLTTCDGEVVDYDSVYAFGIDEEYTPAGLLVSCKVYARVHGGVNETPVRVLLERGIDRPAAQRQLGECVGWTQAARSRAA